MKTYLIIGAVICVLAIGGGAWVYMDQNKAVSSDLNTLTLEAKQQLDNGEIDAAINNTIQASESDPSNINTLLFLAAAYAQKGSVQFLEEEYGQKALDAVAEVLRIDPNNSEAYRIQGYAYEIMSMWPQATNSYNKSLELNKDNAHTYANRGHMYDLLGNFASARADYQKAISLNPGEDQALFNLARLEARANNFSEAQDLISRGLEKTTNTFRKAEMYQVLANIDLAQKNYADALTNVMKSIDLNDKLAAAYVTRGEIARAELADRIFKKEQIPDLQQKIEDIAADASKATSIYEGQTTAIVLVGRLMVLMGEYDQAVSIFEKALTMIDDDITLGLTEKVAVRAEVTNYIKIINENK